MIDVLITLFFMLAIVTFVLITVVWRINEKIIVLSMIKKIQIEERRILPFHKVPPPPLPTMRNVQDLVNKNKENVIKLHRQNVIFLKNFKPKKKKGPRK